MRKLIPFLCALSLGATATLAAPDSVVITSSSVRSNATVTVTNAIEMSGYLEAVYIDLPDAYQTPAFTTTVTVAGSHETILTATATNDCIFYPIKYADNINGVSTNQAKRMFVVMEKPVVTIATTFTGTVQRIVNIILKMNDH